MLHKVLIIKFLFYKLRVDFRDKSITYKMAFLHFKKKGKLATDIMGDLDLDMPPEPPKIMERESLPEEPINEELMSMPLPKKGKATKFKRKEMSELPSLHEEGELRELQELPPLPGDGDLEEELPPLPDLEEGEGNLPPPPELKTKKQGFFSFLNAKNTAKDLELPKLDEEIPELPEIGEEETKGFPEIPELPEREELPLLDEEEMSSVPPIEIIKAPVVKKPIPKIEDVLEEKEKPVKKFLSITEFKEIQSDINDIKSIVRGVDDVFAKIEEAKTSGDKEYAGLYNNLKDVQSKIMFVDKTLFKEA